MKMNSTEEKELQTPEHKTGKSSGKISLTKQLYDENVPILRRYCLKAVGRDSLWSLFVYESIVTLFSDLGGGLGYIARRIFYRFLFKRLGRGLILGRGGIVRHPWNVSVGERVAIDDNVMIDASGSGNGGIVLGDDVVISRNCVLLGKTGAISIGNRADFGNNVVISAVGDVVIEDSVLIAGSCYIGGGRYNTDRHDLAIMDQGSFSRGTLCIGAGSWVGAGVVILDGVKIGKGCVIGAGSVVTKDLPDFSVAMGVPAKKVVR